VGDARYADDIAASVPDRTGVDQDIDKSPVLATAYRLAAI
jgi:hypothetical protein